MPAKQRRRSHELQPPDLPTTTAVAALPGNELADHASFQQLNLSRADFNGQIAEDVLIEQAVFDHVNLSQTQITTSQLIDVRFDVCDLSGAEWEKPHLSRVEFAGCRIIGTKLLNADLSDVRWSDCVGEFAMFWGTTCERMRFDRCMLRDASFQDANLAGVVFFGCDLSNANFQGATLAGADLRGSKLDGLRVGLKELQGAIIDPTQAIYLASLLGIVVRSD